MVEELRPAAVVALSTTASGPAGVGLGFDPEGALWIADDRRGLFKIPGAPAALERGSAVGS